MTLIIVVVKGSFLSISTLSRSKQARYSDNSVPEELVPCSDDEGSSGGGADDDDDGDMALEDAVARSLGAVSSIILDLFVCVVEVVSINFVVCNQFKKNNLCMKRCQDTI